MTAGAVVEAERGCGGLNGAAAGRVVAAAVLHAGERADFLRGRTYIAVESADGSIRGQVGGFDGHTFVALADRLSEVGGTEGPERAEAVRDFLAGGGENGFSHRISLK